MALAMNKYDRPTGLDLKFSRLGRGIQARVIARSLGVAPQRVSAIEAAFHPSAPMAARYLAALDAVAPPETKGQPVELPGPVAMSGSGDEAPR